MHLEQTNNLKTLTSLALMQTQLLSQDYLSTFLPFIATLTLKKKYENIDISIIVKDFKDEYGIGIPRAPMLSILSKSVSKGLISPSHDGKYLPVWDEMQKISFLSEQCERNSEIDIILNCFIDFVKQKHNIHIDKTEAVDSFVNFLDEYSPRTISGEYDADEEGEINSNKNLYLMGEFIQYSVKTNLTIFDSIRKLSMAYLITTALTFDQPVDSRVNELLNITLYLDTPIVLRLLGLQTEELQLAYKEMFANFKTTINSTFKIFQHTLDEISGIISDCANWIDNPSYNPMYANSALLNFIKRKFNKIQVELYRTTLERKLQEIEIEVDNTGYYNEFNQNTQIDVEIFRKKLIEAYTKNNPNYNVERNSNSLSHDIHSVENIVKLWGRKSSKSYSNLGYLFITTNSTLAYVSRKYTSEYWWDNKNHKSPCITDYYLGTMVWLSTPADKIESVSKLKLLADCSAATTLSREVMEKFTFELQKLKDTRGIKNSDFLLLRQLVYEKNYLQNLTLNEEEAFKDDILEQLLDDIKADIQKPLIETLKQKESEIDNLKIEKNMQNEKFKEFDKERILREKTKTNEVKEIEKLTNKTVKRIINIYAPILFAFFGVLFVLLEVAPFFADIDIFIKITSAMVSFFAVVFGILTNYNIFGMKSKLARCIRKQHQVKRYKRNLDEYIFSSEHQKNLR